MFELNADEFNSLRSQTVISKREGTRYMLTLLQSRA